MLASRAAELSIQSKDVLVVTYNITLINYLRELAARYPDPGRGFTNRVTWLNFHEWCKRVMEEAGRIERYNGLWHAHFQDTSQPEFELADDELEIVWCRTLFEIDLPELVRNTIEECRDRVQAFDAILVDEGQDFSLDWWNLLREVLRPGGEMLLVADESQDIYERATAWTDDAMTGAGFWARGAHFNQAIGCQNRLFHSCKSTFESFFQSSNPTFPKQYS